MSKGQRSRGSKSAFPHVRRDRQPAGAMLVIAVGGRK
jgi:hypothetical protein